MLPGHLNLNSFYASLPASLRSLARQIVRDQTSASLFALVDLLLEHETEIEGGEEKVIWWRGVADVLGVLEHMGRDPIMRLDPDEFWKMGSIRRDGTYFEYTKTVLLAKVRMWPVFGIRGGMIIRWLMPHMLASGTFRGMSRGMIAHSPSHRFDLAREFVQQVRKVTMYRRCRCGSLWRRLASSIGAWEMRPGDACQVGHEQDNVASFPEVPLLEKVDWP